MALMAGASIFHSFRLPRSQGDFVYALAVCGLVAGMMMCLPLWQTGRAFPHLPLWGWCPPLPAPADAVLLWGTVLAVLLSVFSPRLTWAAAVGCLLLALQDQIRWQPWFYQYTLMLVLAALVRDRNDAAWALACRILVVCLYAWGGLHKVTPAYANMYEATFTVPLAAKWPEWAAGLVKHTAPAGPWLEMLMAVALCFRCTRRAGVLLAVSAHGWILLLIGPAGIRYNQVVWPWNLVMIPMVLLLFWRAPEFGWKQIQGARRWIAAGLVVLLCGLMPVFSRTEKWDRYLSFHLYSSTERRLVVISDSAASAAMPEVWRKQLRPSASSPGSMELHLTDVSLGELGVPPPGDQRYMLSLARKFAGMEFARRGRVMFYTDFPFLLRELGWHIFTAEQIGRMSAIPPLRPRGPGR